MLERETYFVIRELPCNIFGVGRDVEVFWKKEPLSALQFRFKVQERVIQLFEKDDKTYIIVERTITREI